MDGVFIVGTDTDVGKTFISALMIQALINKGKNPYYLKPVASGGHIDIDTVRKNTEICEGQSSSPIVFETPCSPHLAREIEEKETIKVETLKRNIIDNCLSTIRNNQFTLIEGAGGVIVPIHREGFDLHHLIEEIHLPVIIVTRTGVGTINHTMLTIEYLKAKGIEIAGIVFNGFNDSIYEKDNVRLIKERSGIPVLGIIPKINKFDESIEEEIVSDYSKKYLDLSPLYL